MVAKPQAQEGSHALAVVGNKLGHLISVVQLGVLNYLVMYIINKGYISYSRHHPPLLNSVFAASYWFIIFASQAFVIVEQNLLYIQNMDCHTFLVGLFGVHRDGKWCMTPDCYDYPFYESRSLYCERKSCPRPRGSPDTERNATLQHNMNLRLQILIVWPRENNEQMSKCVMLLKRPHLVRFLEIERQICTVFLSPR